MTFRQARGHPEQRREVNVDRELQAALGVDPSPEFVARVRMRIASEPPPRRWGVAWIAVAAAAAAIVIAVVAARSMGERKESGQLLASRVLPIVGKAIDRGGPGALRHDDRAADGPVVTQRFTAVSADGRPKGVRYDDRANAASKILIDPREAAALRRLLAGVSAGRVDLKAMLEPSPFVAADMAPVEDIEITPLSIEPLSVSGEGARP